VTHSTARIEQVETILVDLPTIRPHQLAMTTMKGQTLMIVRLRMSDGIVGIGEAATIGGLAYGPESPESMKLAIDTYLAPILLQAKPGRIGETMALIGKSAQGNHFAKCAIETALLDALGKRIGLPVSDFFGGRQHDRLPVAWTLASGDTARDIAEAEDMLARRRHNIFKLKIGKRAVADDVAHVARIRQALGDTAKIRVDVNQAWSLTDARWGLKGLQEIGCELVEQPVQARYLNAMADLTRGHEIAVMADEALNGPEDAVAIASRGAADVFAVKVAQSGGLKRASEVIAIGQAAGLGLYGGTMLETGLGTAAALQLFATVEHLHWGTELFGPLLLTEEILARPIIYRDFCVVLPEGAGIGVDLDPDKVNRFRRDRGRITHAVAGA